MGCQEQDEVLRTLWSLQGFSVREVEIEEIVESNGNRRWVKRIHVQDERRVHHCPDCGKGHRVGLFQEAEERRWRERSIGDLETWIVYAPWRISCVPSSARTLAFSNASSSSAR